MINITPVKLYEPITNNKKEIIVKKYSLRNSKLRRSYTEQS